MKTSKEMLHRRRFCGIMNLARYESIEVPLLDLDIYQRKDVMLMPLPQRCQALLTVALLFFCTGCDISFPFQSDNSSDGSGYLFTLDLAANPKSLDPQSATDTASITIIKNLYEGLLEQDENGNLQTAAAESYTVSDDGLIYTFQLSDDRYWYYDANGDDVVDDGETWTVTASDYVYAFQRIFNPETQSPYAEMFSCLKNGEAIIDGRASYTEIGVQAVSDTQLQFTLDYANTRFLSLLATTAAMPCNETFFTQTKGRYGLDEESVASCGAFYLRLWFYDAYGNDNLIYMRRNSANTAARSVYPSNLTFQIQNTEQDTITDFADGSTDVLVTSIYQDVYMDNDDYNIQAVCATTLGLIFNPDSEVFSNENIRKGLSLGIDRDSIGVESNGDLIGAFSIIPLDVSWNGIVYREAVPETTYVYDVDTAVSTFQKGMQQLGIESLDSTKILVCNSLMDCENLHDIIQTWQEIFGFYIGIEEVTEREYWQRLEDKDYTIAVYGVTGNTNDPAATLEQFASDINSFYYENGSIDEKIASLRKCQTDTELLEQCANVEQAILDDGWFIPIFYKKQYCITTSSNDDLVFDAFSQSLNLRNAKHYT